LRLELSQTARMDQRLVQSPQMIQAMQILQLSGLGLQERIEHELLENPLLERTGDSLGDSGGAARERAEDGERLSALSAVLEGRERDRWEPAFRRRPGAPDEADRKHEAMQNSPAHYRSLGDSLLSQVGLMELDAGRRALLEYLVFSLDARGYLPVPLATLAQEAGIEGATEAELLELLTELRRATHPGIGASDLVECLLLQVERLPQPHPLLARLITHHLADVAANRLPKIAHDTGRPVEDVALAIEHLRTLDPCPGSSFGEAGSEIIRPEVAVQEVDGAFQVTLTRDGSAELSIRPDHAELLRGVARGDSARAWIRQRLDSARWFVDALAQRRDTLLRVAREVFARQAPFLAEGPKAQQPLRMIEVADALGVHVSTISRSVSGKYAQTPHGILPLRSFFSGGPAKASGEVLSQQAVQLRMKELVDAENPAAPLSDDRLARLLRKSEGIPLARRTITKYRRALGIPSSKLRRSF